MSIYKGIESSYYDDWKLDSNEPECECDEEECECEEFDEDWDRADEIYETNRDGI